MTVDSGGATKISFFGGIAFGRLGAPEATRDGRVTMASALDLMALKVAVVCEGTEPRDYLDVAALLFPRRSCQKDADLDSENPPDLLEVKAGGWRMVSARQRERCYPQGNSRRVQKWWVPE